MALTRFYAKELVGFDEVELELEAGLTVFTGVSGSGKSVLMEGILSALGYKDAKALSAEVDVDIVVDGLEDIGIQNEQPNTFKFFKKDKTRYFINSSAVAKKDLFGFCGFFSKYLSSKDDGDFADARLLAVLDSNIKNQEFTRLTKEYKEDFATLQESKKNLNALRQKSLKASEERDFLEFELKKFLEINPKEGEEEELLTLKKELSKKEKISFTASKVESMLAYKGAATELLEFVDKDSQAANDFFGLLEDAFDELGYRLAKLNEVDADAILDRLEKLSYLNKRYGGVSEAIEYFERKKKELKELENLDLTIDALEVDIKSLQKECEGSARRISDVRKGEVGGFAEKLGFYSSKLLIEKPVVSLEATQMNGDGIDKVSLALGKSSISTLSAGEYRRLRLALSACESKEYRSAATLFLDEADANLSGEESAGVAYLLKELSLKYQVFAISHQPQLASVADNHFVVFKQDDVGFVKKLDNDERIGEIARMVSGESISKEALEYAKRLLKEGQEKNKNK